MWPGPGRRHGIRGEGFLTTLFRRACGREERQQVLLTSDPPLCVHHSCPQRRPLPNTTAQGNRRTRAQALRQHLSVDRPVGPTSSTKYTALCSLRGSAIPLFFVLRGGIMRELKWPLCSARQLALTPQVQEPPSACLLWLPSSLVLNILLPLPTGACLSAYRSPASPKPRPAPSACCLAAPTAPISILSRCPDSRATPKRLSVR